MPLVTFFMLIQSANASAAALPPAPDEAVGEARRVTAQRSQAPLLHDTRGRPVMTVTINDRGPFPMVVDTAAQTSLIGASLVHELGLKPLAGGIAVAGATGGGVAHLYPIEQMTNALLSVRRAAVVELPNSSVTDARGIIGMEQFTAGRLLVDRTAGTIAFGPSGQAPEGFVTVAGRRTAEGFVTVPMTLDGVQAPALVDSGAAVTIVNAAAFRLFGWAPDDPRLTKGGEIRGASSGGQLIRSAKVAKLAIGGIILTGVSVMIADDADIAPSIILGSDLLNLFPGYAVDFPRGELQIKLPSNRN